MQTALSAVIALLSLSLVSCFLDKEIFEFCFQSKELKGVTKLYIAIVLLILAWALIMLPGAAQAKSFSDAGEWTQKVYFVCSVASVGTFLIQASIRGAILQKSRNQKTRAKGDNSTPLDDSTKRSVAAPEGPQQQGPDTPKEDGRKPQKEPKPKERAEDSNKEQ